MCEYAVLRSLSSAARAAGALFASGTPLADNPLGNLALLRMRTIASAASFSFLEAHTPLFRYIPISM